MKQKNIYVFYHLFLIDGWQKIFDFHLGMLIKSGLLERCRNVLIGAVFVKESEIEKLKSRIKRHEKLKLLFLRRRSTEVTFWEHPVFKNQAELGEGETIFKMCEFARVCDENDLFLFLHSKGVTKPPDKQRTQIIHFYKKGLKKSSSDEEARQFILRDMSSVIENWRDHVALLEENEVSYYVWNFFWIRGSLLKRFEFTAFRKSLPEQEWRQLNERHATAAFPLKLWALVYGKKLNPVEQYFNFWC